MQFKEKRMKKEHMGALHWTVDSIRGYRFQLLILTAVRIILGVMSVGYALFFKMMVDGAVAGSRQLLIHGIVCFLGFILVQFLLQFLLRFLDEYLKSSLENRLKERLLRNLLMGDFGKVAAVHSGDWMTRLTSDASLVAGSVVSIVPGAAGMGAKLISASGMMLILLPRFTGFLLLGGGVVTLSTFWMRKHLKNLHRQIQESDGSLRVFLTEQLNALTILKAYQQEENALLRAEEKMAAHKSARMKKNRFSNFCNGGFIMAVNLGFMACAAYCGMGILSGAVSYGTFTAAVQLMAQLQSPAAGLTGYIPQYYAMLSSAERLMEADSFWKEEEKPRDQKTDFQEFGFENASFSYPDPEGKESLSVKNLSFSIQKGEYTAFSGPSGCGKSTVLKLLLSLYPLDSGISFVTRNHHREGLTEADRGLFAYVPQGNQLMSGTVREVISFGAPQRRQEDGELKKALEAACALDFVEALPKGLDTVLGERGAGLSEGQMQRLNVARAIFSRRPVLLLDEATSALDETAEKQLLQNLRAMTDRTVIIVTHRPAALQIVDRVLTFSQGQIREEI